MLLDKYEFYDIYALLTGIRFKPNESNNKEMLCAVYNILSAPQKTDIIELNIVRNALRKIDGIDKDLYRWVYVDNVYTYGWRIVKDDFYYSFLSKAFFKMFECAKSEDWKHLEDLADALHNIPIFFADGCKNFKKAVKVQFSHYNKTYATDLLKELSK